MGAMLRGASLGAADRICLQGRLVDLRAGLGILSKSEHESQRQKSVYVRLHGSIVGVLLQALSPLVASNGSSCKIKECIIHQQNLCSVADWNSQSGLFVDPTMLTRLINNPLKHKRGSRRYACAFDLRHA